MLKLEGIVSKYAKNIGKIARNAVVAGGLFAGTVLNANAQNTVSGVVQSIPSRTTPTEAKITLTNTSTGAKYAQRTHDGTFSLNVPNGNYQELVEVAGDYQILGNLAVSGNKVVNEKTMTNVPLTSTVYNGWGSSLLFLFKDLTSTYNGSPGGTILSRARNFPLRIDARNYNALDPLSMPQGMRPYLDTVLLDLNTKTGGIANFSESGNDPVRVQFEYRPTAQMPPGAFGYTVFNYDLTTILIDREFLDYYKNLGMHYKNNGIFARELYRAMGLKTNSADPAMVSHTSGPTVGRFHPDEAEVIKRVFTLDNGTDMSKYKDVVITSIPNIMPQQITFTAPLNGATITYDANGNMVINYNSAGGVVNPRDGDGEVQQVKVRIAGNGIEQFFTDSNTDGVILIPKTNLQPLTQYTLSGTTVSGWDSVNASNIIFFNTPDNPNVPPTQPALLLPANNGIVAPNAINMFKWRKSKDTDPVTYTLNITGNGQNFTYANLADTLFNLPANSLIQNKNYTWKVTATDGKDNVESLVNALSTSNIAPSSFSLVLPATGALQGVSVANTFKWRKSKDNDPISYTLNIFTNGQNLVYNSLTDTLFVVPANTLIQNKSYSWKVTSSDGQATFETAPNTFTTSNMTPGAFSLVSPANSSSIAPNVTNMFKWRKSKDDDPITYSLNIFGNGQNFVYNNITDTLYVLPANILTQNKSYSWRVSAFDGWSTRLSSTWAVTLSNLPPSAFALVGPANNSQIAPNVTNTFRWRKAKDDDAISYSLNIVGNGQNLVYNSLTDTLFVLPANLLKQNKSYAWNVTASDGQATTQSATNNVSTSNIAPAAFATVLPANGAILAPNTTTQFKWRKSKDDDAILYSLNIVGNGQNIIYNSLTDTLFVLPANILKQNKSYTWNVTASDGQATAQSATNNVSTSNIAPTAPVPALPAQDGIIGANVVNTFKWLKSLDDDQIRYILNITGNGQNLVYNNLADTAFALPANILSPNKSYSWKVTATDGQANVESIARALSTSNGAPTPAILVSPRADNIIPPNMANLFQWKKSIDVDPIKYTLVIFGNGLNKSYGNLTDTIFTLPANTLLQNKTYNWKIISNDGYTDVESLQGSFMSGNLAPTVPIGVTPSNNQIVQPNVQNVFKWRQSKDDDQIKYALHLSGTGLNLVYDNLTDTAFVVPANIFAQNKDYSWYVTGSDGKLLTPSNPIDFKSGNLAPGAFNIVSHTGAEEVKTDVDNIFKWKKSKDEDPILYTLEFSGSGKNTITFNNIADTLYNVPKNTLDKGGYNVKVIASDGKATTETAPLSINTITGIEDTLLDEPLVMYPNPVRSNLNLKISTRLPSNFDVDIYSINGQKLAHKEYRAIMGEYIDDFDMDKYSSGTYIAKINFKDKSGKVIGTQSRKIIKY